MKKILLILSIILVGSSLYGINRSKGRLYSYKDTKYLNTELDNIYSALNSKYINGNYQISGELLVNGNLGIGTATPTDKLHVDGDVTIDGSINSIYSNVLSETTNYINITGLDGDSDIIYELYFYVVPFGAIANIELTINYDSGANYYLVYIIGNGTTPTTSSGSGNYLVLAGVNAGTISIGKFTIFAKSGNYRSVSGYYQSSSGLDTGIRTGMWNNSADNITSIQLTASSNSFNTGSYFKLYKKR